MAKREAILDGLAWAGITEQARVARISALLVRELTPTGSHWNRKVEHTKTRVREAVRDTSPPYGRGKAICEAVEQEYRRQLPTYAERLDNKEKWEKWLEHQAKLSTRRNRAYAFRFDRPMFEPCRDYPKADDYGDDYDWDAHHKWHEEENERDKGDRCIGLTHWNGYTVALVSFINEDNLPHIATRKVRGPVVRTYLRDEPENLVEAAVSLGGPKVKAAMAVGKKVVTDWAGRRSFIHHEGQDHVRPHVEEVPWLAAVIEENKNRWGYTEYEGLPVIVHGETVTPDWEARKADEDDDDY